MPNKSDLNLFIVIGMTGSGKSTVIAEMQKRLGLKRIKTTTTRPRRSENDNEYNFVALDSFLNEAWKDTYVAKRDYRAVLEGAPQTYWYGVRRSDLKGTGVMITDFQGVKDLYKDGFEPVVIYLHADRETRLERAKARGGFIEAEFERRTLDDESKFTMPGLIAFGKEHPLYIVSNNTSDNIDEVYDKVEMIIRNFL